MQCSMHCSAGSASTALSSVRGLMTASFSSPQAPNLGGDPPKSSPAVVVPGQATAVSNSGTLTSADDRSKRTFLPIIATN